MKKILSAILVLAMLLTASVCLFACDDEENNQNNGEGGEPQKVTYTVTVVDNEGNPVKGAEITFMPKGATAFPFPTDKEGKASYRTDKELSIKVTEIPAGYEYNKLNKEQNFDENGNLTITLTKPAPVAPLVIKVVDEEGNPIAGVKVQMCDSAGLCKKPVTTNEDGEGYYDFVEGDFHAQLTLSIDETMTEEEIAQVIAEALPEGYTVENPTEYRDFVDGVATIILKKIAE